MLGSIDAKMKGYIGPEYDGDGLDKAKILIKQAMTTFPQRDQATNDLLYKDLDLIANEQARRSLRARRVLPTHGLSRRGRVLLRRGPRPLAEVALCREGQAPDGLAGEGPAQEDRAQQDPLPARGPRPERDGQQHGQPVDHAGRLGGGGSPGSGP